MQHIRRPWLRWVGAMTIVYLAGTLGAGPSAASAQQSDSVGGAVTRDSTTKKDKMDCAKVNEALMAVLAKKQAEGVAVTGGLTLSPGDVDVPMADLMRCSRQPIPVSMPAGSSESMSGSTSGPALMPVTPAPGDTVCQIQVAPIGQVLPAELRAQSPLDSVTFHVNTSPVKVCYGRPSSRGRTMIGGESVPYGQLWRTGANEPTTIITPIPLTIAGIAVPAGIYSLYTVPGEKQWEIIINRSISQWGIESDYTASVKAQEVGRAKVKSEPVTTPIETFTIRSEPVKGNDKAASLTLEWEKTRVTIPVKAKK